MKGGQGQSDATVQKQRGLAGILRINFQAHLKHSKYPYHHIEMNCGRGYNEQVQCAGSPLTFLETARKCGVTNYVLHCVDRDKKAIAELYKRLLAFPTDRWFLYNGDNRDFPKAIPDLVRLFGDSPKYALGSILCDPNGVDIDFEALSYVATTCRRLDFVLNYNISAWLRNRGARNIPKDVFLFDQLKLLHKNFWLIREPLGHSKFSLLVGRNLRMGDWQAAGFYYLDSQRGQEILLETLSENEHSGNLFEL